MFSSRKDRQFTLLVEAWSADLFRYAVWLCRDKSLAEELVQETFLRAWKGIDSLKDPAATRSWLITILRRELFRVHGRAKLKVTDIDTAELNDPAFNQGVGLSLELRKALDSLPDDYKEPLLLQILGGFSCEEIADLTDSNKGAVMTRLFRARDKMRKFLEAGSSDEFMEYRS